MPLPSFSDFGDYRLAGHSLSVWSTRLGRAGRVGVTMAISLLATYLGGCVLALAVYAAVFPPITGVQLQRSLEATLSGTESSRTYTPVPLTAVDRSLLRSAVAGEDSRFFEHNGIDWEAVGEAVEEYREGEDLRGASTITQQLVKNLFLTTHSTYVRKALEVPLTYAAELLLSKRRILELYLNVIEWGPGVYGAEAAAQYHYGISARHLNRYQAAALAACIPNPRVRRPETVGWYQRIILGRLENLPPLPL
ncbi:monofunctional biosynthetic peptidoglycan transglycosylase [Salinibacter sp. 10B]|uniref:monofunctional biosynthetic peptidoglycan transglycosylase n=1 Tax=Salinibacter sp. 10B TaxID=1923971 RepID=UPI002157E564|nr:monofunctional biosynthetic peptidoglycan transglycosylase [Salinibacter sp. 10B]